MVRASFIITSGYTLIGVRHCSALFRCRPRPWKSARNWNNCGRLKQECGLMWRSLTQLRWVLILPPIWQWHARYSPDNICLLYTSDAADDLLCVDLGGRRIIKKK